jgi:hypothetical protein
MSDRARRVGAPVLLLLAIAVALLIPTGLTMADPESEAADQLGAILGELPSGATVLVGFDPDLGTYAEIRPTVRTLLADLAGREAAIGMISLTPEGRAIGLAEVDRTARLTDLDVTDLGFVPGGEAALVTVATAIAGNAGITAPDGSATLGRPDLIVVIGGNDLGPRSWVEQVQPRIEGIPVIAITPAALLPEVEPYRASGQLAALVSTPRDGATYRADADVGPFDELGDASGGPSALAILTGLVIAIGWIGASLVRRIAPGPASRAERERP